MSAFLIFGQPLNEKSVQLKSIQIQQIYDAHKFTICFHIFGVCAVTVYIYFKRASSVTRKVFVVDEHHMLVRRASKWYNGSINDKRWKQTSKEPDDWRPHVHATRTTDTVWGSFLHRQRHQEDVSVRGASHKWEFLQTGRHDIYPVCPSMLLSNHKVMLGLESHQAHRARVAMYSRQVAGSTQRHRQKHTLTSRGSFRINN